LSISFQTRGLTIGDGLIADELWPRNLKSFVCPPCTLRWPPGRRIFFAWLDPARAGRHDDVMTDAPLPPAPVPQRALEIALYAEDMETCAAFYDAVIGLERGPEVPGRHVFFRLGKGMLLLFNPKATVVPTENSDLPVPPHGAAGEGHLCFAADRAAIAAWRARLRAAGVPIEAEFDWPNGARSLYCRDPAGNSIEFAEPRLWERRA